MLAGEGLVELVLSHGAVVYTGVESWKAYVS